MQLCCILFSNPISIPINKFTLTVEAVQMTIFRNILICSCAILISVTAAPAHAEPLLTVFVSIQPQQYFVEKIGGDAVTVHVMVAPGASPATYEPKPRQMAELASAALYFAIGVPFERTWLDRFRSANKNMKVIPTQEGIERVFMAGHVHGESGDDSHAHHGHDGDGFKDPHVWLSPPLVMMQARNILNALQTADPARADQYRHGYRQFIQEVASLDTALMARFGNKDRPLEFMVFHPSWGYFAQAYGLRQIPIEIEGKEPKPADLGKIATHARANRLQTIFVQPQFSRKSAETIAKTIGADVAVLDPLAPDWADNLKRAAESIAKAVNRP